MTNDGLIFNIKKFAIHDGPGIRTTIFFFGCPLDCWWCHNPECKLNSTQNNSDSPKPISNNSRKAVSEKVTVDKIITEVKKDIVFYDQSGGGVTFSGGEPLLQPEFLKNCLIACKKLNIHTTIDTTGYVVYEDFEKINEWVDLYLYDLKIIDENAHLKYTSVSNKLILENLDKLANAGKNINIRIPLIPGITDTDDNIGRTIEILNKIRNIDQISLLPYNKFGEDKLKRYHFDDKIGSLKVQSNDEIKRIADKFIKHDYQVSIGG